MYDQQHPETSPTQSTPAIDPVMYESTKSNNPDTNKMIGLNNYLQSEVGSLREQNLQLLEQSRQRRKQLQQEHREQMKKIKESHQKQINFLKAQQEMNRQSSENRDKILTNMDLYLKQSLDKLSRIYNEQQQSEQITDLKAKISEKDLKISVLEESIKTWNSLSKLKDDEIGQLNKNLDFEKQEVVDLKKSLQGIKKQKDLQKKRYADQLKQMKIIAQKERQNLQNEWQHKFNDMITYKQSQLDAEKKKFQNRVKSQGQILASKDKLQSNVANLSEKLLKYDQLIKQKDHYKQQLAIADSNHKQQLKNQQVKIKADIKLQYMQQQSKEKIELQNQLKTLKDNFKQESKKIKQSYQSSQTTYTTMYNSKLKEKDKIIFELQEKNKALEKQLDNQIKCMNQQIEACESTNKQKEQQIRYYKQQEQTVRNNLKPLYKTNTSNPSPYLPQLINDAINQERTIKQSLSLQYDQQKRRSQQLALYIANIKKDIQDLLQSLQSTSEISGFFCRNYQDPYNMGSEFKKLVQCLKAVLDVQKGQRNKIVEQLQKVRSKNIIDNEELRGQREKNTKLSECKAEIEMQKFKLENHLKRVIEQNKIISSKKKDLELELKNKITQLQAQIKRLRLDIEDREEQIKKASEQIQSLQGQQENSNNTIRTLRQQIKKLEAQIKLIKQALKNKDIQHDSLASEFKQKELILKQKIYQSIQEDINQLNKTLQELFGDQPTSLSFPAIRQFLLSKKTNLSQNAASTAFTVSEILERMPKEREFLHSQCCEFFKCRDISSKLSFKYDDYSKNFANYIPNATRKFAFLVLFKAKKSQAVFGLISTSIGRDSTSMAFNLNTMKVMKKTSTSRVMPSSFDNNILKFGNEQISIKSGWATDLNVNTGIIGERYFSFSREELVGKGEVSPVSLQAMEIHRIYTV